MHTVDQNHNTVERKRSFKAPVVFGLLLVFLVVWSCLFALPSCAEKTDNRPSVIPVVFQAADDLNKSVVIPQAESDPEPEPAPAPEPENVAIPIIATCQGVEIHSPIAPADLTGVLFHQASYAYGLVMQTSLPEISEEAVGYDRPWRIGMGSVNGWLDADALHLWRVQDTTQMDTSIDVGARAGMTVFAPVTGTVVLVKPYDLYGYVPDIEIHIQPDGHPELDVVLLHQYDPMVSAGDHVEGGITPISHVRDIAASLTDIQLGYYTFGDDPGNHSHVQVNDTTYPGYYADKLYAFGAFVTPEQQEMYEQAKAEVATRQQAEQQAAQQASQSESESDPASQASPQA